ncbi:MAG: hypothetical protein K6T61_11810 [Bryobacteraceae bacterium]|nr:hypothetical protein [Bryobacteraceae bacterium]
MEKMRYESTRTVESAVMPGVRFRIRKMSLERRVELTRRLAELLKRIEYLEAGRDPEERIAAAEAAAAVERIHLEWGLEGIEGLEIDGKPATVDTLIAAGPEALSREVLEAIRAECGLSEAERKN